MKTVITSTENKLNDRFDLRFGRAEWFCVFDDVTGRAEFKENLAGRDSNGTGIKAAELVAQQGAVRVISGDFGPKARDLLDRLKIQMVILQDDELRIEDIIRKLSLKR